MFRPILLTYNYPESMEISHVSEIISENFILCHVEYFTIRLSPDLIYFPLIVAVSNISTEIIERREKEMNGK